jgi:hypothetical protein
MTLARDSAGIGYQNLNDAIKPLLAALAVQTLIVFHVSVKLNGVVPDTGTVAVTSP